MNENIGRLRTTGEKTKSALAIEPLYVSFFPIALRGDYDMCPLWQLGGADRCELVDGEDADGVQTFWRLNCFADDAGALVGRLEVGASKAGNVDENVR